MTHIEFHVDGLPKGQPRPRAFYNKAIGQARCYDAGTAEGWKSCIAQAAKPFIPAVPIDGPIFLHLQFTMPRPKAHYLKSGLRTTAPNWVITKPDLDNMEKAVMDCMTRLAVWHDDSQVADKRSSKKYGAPGCTITINQLEP